MGSGAGEYGGAIDDAIGRHIDSSPLVEILANIHRDFAAVTDGQVASYIPELAQAVLVASGQPINRRNYEEIDPNYKSAASERSAMTTTCAEFTRASPTSK